MLEALNADEIAAMSFADLTARKELVLARLHEISSEMKPSKVKSEESIPYTPKTDTHWDFLMKEMMWLAADFQSERKRQVSTGKKVAFSIRQFHKTKEARRTRELAEAELKRRRLAGRIGREVKGWWTKIERVIAYKQKVESDVERRKAMNKQLVALVNQTERYGESLALHGYESDVDGCGRKRRLTIEEALAVGTGPSRRSKGPDYALLDLQEENFFGETTMPDSGSDSSFVLEAYSTDDESTLLEAEATELAERRRRSTESDDDDDASYYADPEELRKLKEEGDMDVNEVLERLRREAVIAPDTEELEDSAERMARRRVRFARNLESSDAHGQAIRCDHGISKHPKWERGPADPGSEADDDADASDVEDFARDDSSDEEFEVDANEMDDETTIAAEELLEREMTAEEEIELLQRENEMSVEELRIIYSMPGASEDETEESRTEESRTEESQTEESQTIPTDAHITHVHSVEDSRTSALESLFDADDAGEEDEFCPMEMEVDDETTLEAEERLGRDMSHDQEMALLQQDSEIPIEQLRAMYAEISNDLNDDSSVDADAQSQSSTDNGQSLVKMLENGDSDDGDEFLPKELLPVDDETTIEAEEKLEREMTYEDEINLLKRENEIPVEELRRMYAGMDNDDGSDTSEAIIDEDDHESEDEYRPDVDVVDDETTIEAEERLAREMSVEDEITLLQKESTISIEDLISMYSRMEEREEEPVSSDQDKSSFKENGAPEHRLARKRSRPDSDDSDVGEDEGLAALQALKDAEERARATLATRPFLLSSWVKLREYQQIGLNWLVSIQSRRLNGILADEMGLGKTLQTIALLAYLAAYKGLWGPHLIIVPTSCIINWESEFKRFCPGLKVLCYYGSAKRRKELRSGWTKANWYHVIITSYQLAVQDSFAFKRKKWYYLILDEAHNIKNFESQRWQTLINFNTQRRLLLTGTPLQNNLMELWSLLHFLMPHVFRSRKEFSYWFSNPMNNIIEGNAIRSDDLINRLHGIIRPFVLRRLKKDVETQMPGKFEHIVKCQLSRRQMFLYEEFMARSSTRQALRKGSNFMGMMNVLMQLRKVCNHPDLFEPRSVITPFVMNRLSVNTAGIVFHATSKSSALETLSEPIVHPLWCCNAGIIDQDLYLNHDSVTAAQLRRLEEDPFTFVTGDVDVDEPAPDKELDAELASLLMRMRHSAREDRQAKAAFHKELNSKRCRAPAFPYCSRLVNAVTVGEEALARSGPEIVSGSQIISTPMQLLAMRRNQQERGDDLDDLVKNFVFCVPKVGAPRPVLDISIHDAEFDEDANRALIEPLEGYFRPFRKAHARLSSFFPDKKLIQFDAGKLQTLAKLLRELKHGGHRALIFTQMSKMLDVLEAFLNLNGHTYLRLDGSTGVDRRQRMMDRFNNDPKIFCFILSTRSGGLGINLTGADSVIFYDSDWNPAMDAQAQDRAHRIGQTREVHIYRLITEHTIEENILIKAQQKKKLDLLVMNEGKFDASYVRVENPLKNGNAEAGQGDIYSKGGLRSILGMDLEDSNIDNGSKPRNGVKMDGEYDLTKEQMEQTMAALEDEDDVLALRGAQKEAADELKEFDETIELSKEEGDEGEDDERGIDREEDQAKPPSPSNDKFPDSSELAGEQDVKKSDEAEMEREFEAWQNEVGMDASAIENSLSATEWYALNFREVIDPFYSIFAIAEYKRKMEAAESVEEIDLDELERTKVIEERYALEDGDLLGTSPHPEELLRQKHLYCREKSRLRSNKKRRKLTGENWATKIDGVSRLPFWYNADTGEALWDKPLVLIELEAYETALEKHWNAMPLKPLIHIMEFLLPFPERCNCSLVCRQWRMAASDVSFVRHVYPVEMGVLAQAGRQLEHNHYRTLEEALSIALPGDTIELGDGHYWVSEPGLNVKMPIRIIGDEHDPAHVIVELSGVVQWSGKGGWIEGVTFRRLRMAKGESNEILRVHSGGRVDMSECVLDNEGSEGSVAVVNGAGSTGRWFNTHIRGSEAGAGVLIESGGSLDLRKCTISNNHGHGLSCNGGSTFRIKECTLQGNSGSGLHLHGESKGQLEKCRFVRNGSIFDKESGCSCAPCTGNVAIVSSAHRAVPGFRIVSEDGQNDKAVPIESSMG